VAPPYRGSGEVGHAVLKKTTTGGQGETSSRLLQQNRPLAAVAMPSSEYYVRADISKDIEFLYKVL
jgi:hypothetical protein